MRQAVTLACSPAPGQEDLSHLAFRCGRLAQPVGDRSLGAIGASVEAPYRTNQLPSAELAADVSRPNLPPATEQAERYQRHADAHGAPPTFGPPAVAPAQSKAGTWFTIPMYQKRA
jgi:hypothetical protein